MSKKHLVVLSGAGISAESGLKTFRDSGGLWEGHDVMEVASLQGWLNNPELVLDFYNMRRKEAATAKPNQAHIKLADLEEHFDVTVITQNVDELHERAGSSRVVHLHGKLSEIKSSANEKLIFPYERDLKIGDLCPEGSQLRPNIVWFGEMVPMMERAADITAEADIFLVIGTSLAVYPAASLHQFLKNDTIKIIIDPKVNEISLSEYWYKIEEIATKGLEKLSLILKNHI